MKEQLRNNFNKAAAVSGISAVALLGVGCSDPIDREQTFDINIVCEGDASPIVGNTEVNQNLTDYRTATVDVVCIGDNGEVAAPVFLELDKSTASDDLDQLRITVEKFDKGSIYEFSTEINKSENKGAVELVRVSELASAEIVESGE